MISQKAKITIFGLVCFGSFIFGRSTAPKAKPEIKIIDNSKSIEKAIEDTQKQMTQALQKQIVRETHTVHSKSGNLKTDVKEVITFNKNSVENVNQQMQSDIKLSNTQTAEVKSNNTGIDYSFMVGRALNNSHYDYIASIGVPLFAGIKANAGYEFQDKKIFVGTTFNF